MGRRFIGVDLGADPARTGLAVLADDGGRLRVESAVRGASDEEIIEAIGAGVKAGVDVPLGWPAPFVGHLKRHAAGADVGVEDSGPEWRRGMALRRTDLRVWEVTGQRPLSVSTDLIAHPALRWSAVESRLRAGGVDCARDGSGRIAEVYPAAALRVWGLPYRGYKKTDARAVREQIIEGLDVDFGSARPDCLASDDILDAVIAAIVAHQVCQGRTQGASASERELALIEGWIHVPAPVDA